MPTLRIALAQVDSTVGDLPGNAAVVRECSRRASTAGAQLVAFPELMLTGYPVEDLVFREAFVRDSRAALERLAADLAADGLGELPVVVGYLDADGPARMSAEADPQRGPRNALAVLHGGRVVTRYFKHHLPNYGVFDEGRYFVSGDTLRVVRIGGVDVAFTICEDMWQAGGPFAVAGAANVGLVININASPYELNKDDARADLVCRRAAEAGATVAFVNTVGAQDELVYDGDSMVVTAGGTILTRAPQFVERLVIQDLALPAATGGPSGEVKGMIVDRLALAGELPPATGELPAGEVLPRLPDEAEVWHALVTGLRDYVRKNGFTSVVIALSGGIDSAVVASVAVDALGPDRVVCVSMPSEYSSEHSKDDAAELAKRTGLDYRTEPIVPMMDAFLANLSLSGLAVENLQARIRGIILMALSNQEGHLVLTTGNKSELAVGYSTLYGDSVGGFNPLKDVFKLMVYRIARWRNSDAEARGQVPPIPENILTKAPSAELRPGQVDSDSLPPYEVLDPILAGYVDGDLGPDQLAAAGHDPDVIDRVVKLVDLAEYKRRQSAPGPKISPKAFGRDRRLPITNRYHQAVTRRG